MKRFPSVTIERKSAAGKQLRTFALLATASICLFTAPASARDIAPEISSRVWLENDSEVAAVSLNGKDLITFRAHAGSGDAADEADDLAAHLQDLITDKDFDASQLLPGKEGDKAVLRLSGDTALTFLPLNTKSKAGTNCFEASLQVANGIRAAMGAQTLPSNFPDLSDRTAIANAGKSFSGKASWYGPGFHGRKTSDGHRFDMEGLTAAHRSLPFGTKLLVMNRKTGDSCVVEVNDRGPYVGNRVLDLSRGAARRLNMLGSGVAMVDCLIIGSAGSAN